MTRPGALTMGALPYAEEFARCLPARQLSTDGSG